MKDTYYRPTRETNDVNILHEMSIFIWHLKNATAYHYSQ